jgi:ubiquinone/menaquinone biosynthesis C-methylase UbiE
MSQLSDHWSAGSTYEQFMGRWSRRLAREFVRWLHAPSGLEWLELGCGTGALTTAICEHADPATVVACDPATSFIDYARRHIRDPRASFILASATDFPLEPDGYDVIASLLALNFFPDPAAAMERMRLAAAPGGTITASVWDYGGEMQFLRHFWDAAIEVESDAREMDEGTRFPICTPENLSRLFRNAGLVDVRCEPIEIVTVFESFEDYWTPFLGATGPAPAFVSALSAEKRDRLRSKLDATLPRRSDGTIQLRARAWAIRGTNNPR